MNIKGLTREELFMVLFNYATPASKIITLEKAREYLKQFSSDREMYFSSVMGKQLCISFHNFEKGFVPISMYDSINGFRGSSGAVIAITSYRNKTGQIENVEMAETE